MFERKKFLKLLKETKENKYDIVLIFNLDRLTRNYYESIEIEKHFRYLNNCKLISISEDINLNTATGRIMFRMKMALSCFFVEDMFEKQKVGIERAKDEGKYTGGKRGRSWKWKKN